jgi:hypothetical protein
MGRRDQPVEPRFSLPTRRERTRQGSEEGLVAAVLVAVFLHFLLFWATPAEIFPHAPEGPQPSASMEVVLEQLPEEAEMEERYVRAAPDIAEETPEETMNISDRDQVAAQPEQAPTDPENTPYVEGDEEISNRLVQGNPRQEPSPQAPPAASPTQGQSPVPQQEAAPRQQARQQPEPDTLEKEAESEEGLASREEPQESKEPPEETPAPEDPLVAKPSPRDGRGEDRQTTPPQSEQQASQQPRPRQRVERDTSFGPIKDNRQGVVRIGRLAFDSQYSEFGEYWRRVAEIIEARWRNLVYNTKAIPFNGNRVVVEFSITRKGAVEGVRVAFSNAGKLAETISQDAIVAEAPYFDWTPEMIVRMGERAPCSIHFYY